MKKALHLVLGSIIAATLLLSAATASAAEKGEKGSKSGKADKYPLDTCVVSDEKLDSMGEPFVIKHEGKEVKLCCKPCQKEFKKEPAKYMKKLEDAEKKSKSSK
ncbi:MAG: TRASH domain-containing protein [Verrucomicrobiales bacterium]